MKRSLICNWVCGIFKEGFDELKSDRWVCIKVSPTATATTTTRRDGETRRRRREEDDGDETRRRRRREDAETATRRRRRREEETTATARWGGDGEMRRRRRVWTWPLGVLNFLILLHPGHTIAWWFCMRWTSSCTIWWWFKFILNECCLSFFSWQKPHG